MIVKPISYDLDGKTLVNPSVIDDLKRTGCAVPDVERVIFNRGSKRTYKTDADGNYVIDEQTKKRVVESERPTLATTVYFADGTKITVVNSAGDKVVDENGNVTISAKETGYIHAIMKRLVSRFGYDDNGNLVLKSEGYGTVLRKVIENSIDQQEVEAKKAKTRAEAKAKFEETKGKSKRKRASLGECANTLADAVNALKSVVEELKATK